MARQKNAEAQESQTERRQPSAKFRMGRISATVWENQGEKGPWFTTTILRSYKDGDDWKSTSSFGREDLPLVEKVAAQALFWIFRQQQQQGGEATQEGGNGDIPF
jgi:hypothetical protein